MDPTTATWHLTCRLLTAAAADLDAGADPGSVALAHAGAAVMLFQSFDVETAERIAAAIESRSAH